jgi:hypothetical protein
VSFAKKKKELALSEMSGQHYHFKDEKLKVTISKQSICGVNIYI